MKDKYIDDIFKNVDKNIVLDEEQKNVILDESQNLIVIAGAGTGKTTTISAKVKYLIDIKKIKPNEILIISFTNKAIVELKTRINEEFNLPVNIFTFHKFAYDLLKEEDKRYKITNNSEKIIEDIINSEEETKKIIKILKKNKAYRKLDDKYIDSRKLLCSITYELIQLLKILNVDLDKKYKTKTTDKYVEYLKKILIKYNDTLEKNMYLDFEDLIIKASKLERYQTNYKYIIVDEYQDVSINKFKFLKNLVDKTNAKTIVVGDDFQTIFSFAGSKIDLFLNYKEKMDARLLKITRTYRNSQELIDVAGKFIMRNELQIKKTLKSTKKMKCPIEIYGYKNNFDEVFEKILRKIINEFGTNKNVLVLGRYNMDISLIKSNKFSIRNGKIKYLLDKSVEIDFLTIHASKGLGYDNVILINFTNEYMGFPSNIDDLFLKKEIIGVDNNYDEERRLFYVALTRTKNKVYILSKIKKESVFMYDICNSPNVYVDYKVIIKGKNKHSIK